MANNPFSPLPHRQGHHHQFFYFFFASFGLLAALSSFPVVSSATTDLSSPAARNNYVAAAAYNVTSTTLAVCPPPLIPNIYSLTTLGCNGACCIPCPVSTAFYEPHKLESAYTTASIARVASTLSCLFLSICYLILPSRRKHPHLIVLVFVMLMIPWMALGTAWLFQKEELLCVSAYEIADMTNSWFCGLSGTLLPYMSLVILSLGALLITNLHLLTVYRSSLIQNSLGKLMILTFILPLGAIIPVVIKRQIMYPGFGSICFMGPDMAGAYFFLPLSIVACIGALLHLGTIAFMVKAAIVANSASSVGKSHSLSSNGHRSNDSMTPRQRRLQVARDVTLQLKQQWRPGLLAFWLLIMDTVYCLFYFFEAKKLLSVKPSTPWFQEWVSCLAAKVVESAQAGRISMTSPTSGQFVTAGEYAQRTCASIAAPFVPNFIWAAWSDLLPAIYGVTVLIIFGSKLELWQDLRDRLFGKRYIDGGKFIMGDLPKDNGDSNNVYDNNKHHRNENGPSIVGDSKNESSNIENPYGSQTNLAPVVRISLQKNCSTSAPAATLEPWNPSAWITISTDGNFIEALPRAASPQPSTSNIGNNDTKRF
ncbi:hypothetical protein BGZ95_010995 [Linnemannia exigua]|uniref:G-protein coupled receptors family 2 profile 2 domain-containing protein n=1 Tax=Linnemannia exigua TaxID=604196 RepID=A0AAD4DB33_9FUNG|nr:hypothetical protein BGZ95_010995 [Linnemannia exigua]